MIFDNIYKNTITFNTTGNVEFRFIDNRSQTRYLLDIVIDNNIMINNVFSIGTFKNIGTTINNSATPIGISLDNTKVTLVMSGSHIVDIKIKQGIFSVTNNSVATPTNFTIPIGYSFGVVKQIMTETNRFYYIDSLLTPVSNDVLHNNTTYPKFAYISKLNASSISDFIEDSSIPNALFINNNLEKSKLEQSVQTSLALGDSAVQNIYINGKASPEAKVAGAINLNLSNLIKSLKKDNTTYFNYNTDANGITTIDYDSIDIQSKILNLNNDGKKYFITYSNDLGNRYSYEYADMDLFFRKDNNIKSDQTISETDDLLYSSLKIKNLLENKVETTSLTPVSDKFIKFRINTQGQVIDNVLVSRTDLSNLLDIHYQKSGVKKVMNTARSTIFFM